MKELLKALAEADRELEAPEAVERRLQAAFRKRYARSKWPYFAVAIAAGVLLAIYLRPKPAVHPQPIQTAVVTQSAVVVPVARPVARKVVHRRPPPREVTTDFYPLIEDAPPFEGGELLRVSLPALAMRGVGLPVSEDRLNETVQADVLVGQEGLARAIRFVNRP